MRKLFSVVLVLAAALAHTGCATLADAKNERGSGEVRVYSHSKDVVWDGLIEVLGSTELEIVSENKAEGMVLAQRAMTAFSYGENVAIFVEEVNGRVSTRIEIVNKRALATNITAANWADRIFDKLDEKLR